MGESRTIERTSKLYQRRLVREINAHVCAAKTVYYGSYEIRRARCTTARGLEVLRVDGQWYPAKPDSFHDGTIELMASQAVW